MKKNYWVTIVPVATLLIFIFLNTYSVPIGRLQLPPISAPISETSLMQALALIHTEPVTSHRLQEKDRKPFLQFVQQICALEEVSNRHEIYISKNAEVWLILQENWPSSKAWFDDPVISLQNSVAVKKITPNIMKLYP